MEIQSVPRCVMAALIASTACVACTKPDESSGGTGGSGSKPVASAAPDASAAPRRASRVEFGGWTFEVASARTQRDPITINDPYFTSDAVFSGARKIAPEGVLWLVTVRATLHVILFSTLQRRSQYGSRDPAACPSTATGTLRF